MVFTHKEMRRKTASFPLFRTQTVCCMLCCVLKQMQVHVHIAAGVIRMLPACVQPERQLLLLMVVLK